MPTGKVEAGMKKQRDKKSFESNWRAKLFCFQLRNRMKKASNFKIGFEFHGAWIKEGGQTQIKRATRR